METVVKCIIDDNDENDIHSRVYDAMSEYVWDWEDDFDTLEEAYEETGRGSAESQILNEVISEYAAKAGINLDDIPVDIYSEIFDKLAAHWNLSTD